MVNQLKVPAWPHAIGHYTKKEVEEFCVQDRRWQEFRMSMLGKSTDVKLGMLAEWWNENIRHDTRRTCIQCWNYLAALRRGGLLDDNNRVKR